MATPQTSTFRTCRRILAVPAAQPTFKTLTRNQRRRFADLAMSSGVPAERWIERALDNFLEDEAPLWFMKGRLI